MIEAEAHTRPTPFEYELAYQARVAIDRIRFAIQHTEKFAPHTDHMREAVLQLLDALDRLQSAERRFQQRFRHTPRMTRFKRSIRKFNPPRMADEKARAASERLAEVLGVKG